MRMVTNTSPSPVGWLLLFIGLSVAVTFAGSWRVFDVPREGIARVVAPLQAGVSRVAHGLRDAAAGWHEVSRLRSENEALRNTVDDLLQETVRLRAAELENRELRDQLRYTRDSKSQSLVPAEVIG